MSKKTVSKNSNQEQDLTSKIFLVYRKKCDINGIQVSSFIKQKLQLATQQGILQHFQTSQQLGANQARAFIDALYQIKYTKLKTLRLWKSQIGDQGLRIISKYLLVQDNALEVLDLLDNRITSLGCQFFGKALLNPDTNLRQIKLDNNLIGTQGLKNLVIGLRTIPTLDKLSLKYCNIDSKGAKYIQQIIANINSKLRSIKLQGNPLQNQGVYQVLKAMRTCGQTIEKINIADVKMNLLTYKPSKEYLQKQIKKQKKQTQQKDEQDEQFKFQFKKQQSPKKEYNKQQQNQSQTALFTKLSLQQPKQNEQTKNKQHTIEQKIKKQILQILKNNILLIKFQCRFNQIHNQIAQQMLTMIQNNKSIKNIQFPNNVKYQLRDTLDTIIRQRNKKGKKGKKKTSKK